MITVRPAKSRCGSRREQRLGGGVESRRRFIEDDDARVLQKDPGEGEKLLLTRRQPLTPGAELCVELDRSHPLPQAGPVERGQDLIVAG